MYCRAWILWFKYNLTEQKDKHSKQIWISFDPKVDARRKAAFSQEWFIHNAKYTSDSFLLKAFALVLLFEAIILLTPIVYTPGLATEKFSDSPSTNWCSGFVYWNFLTNGVMTAKSVLVFILAYQFRTFCEGAVRSSNQMYSDTMYNPKNVRFRPQKAFCSGVWGSGLHLMVLVSYAKSDCKFGNCAKFWVI